MRAAFFSWWMLVFFLTDLFGLAIAADLPPFVRSSYQTTDPDGTKRLWEYPAIRVRRAQDADDADLQLFHAQGYEHAKRREFPQMNFFSRLATGEIAGLVGEKGIEQDLKAIAVDLPGIVDRTLAVIKKDYSTEYKILESYADGVNAFTRTNKSFGQAMIGAAFKYEDWTPRKSIAIAVAFTYLQSAGFEEALMLGTIYQKLYLDKNRGGEFKDFIDPRAIETRLPDDIRLPEIKSIANHLPAPLDHFPTYQCQTPVFPFKGCEGRTPGSNAWAIRKPRLDPQLKAAAILESDPHMILMNPSLFFPMMLDSLTAGGRYFVRGYTVAGLPGVVIGENDHFAWSMTNRAGHDDQPYIEELSPDGSKVKFKGEWVALEQKIFKHHIGDKTVDRRVRIVPHHGPIISDFWPGISNLKKDTAISIKWGCSDKIMEFVGILKVNRAKNWDEFKDGIHYFCGVGGNFIYADREGNIGFQQYSTRAPKRPWASKQNLPYLPVSGTGNFEWDGYFDEFPEIYNPASNFIAITNDDMLGLNLKPYLSDFQNYRTYRATEGFRRTRITDLIESAEKPIDLAKAMSIQNDHYDLSAQRFIQEFLKAADQAGEISANQVGKRLLNWNYQMEKDSKEGLLWITWLGSLMSDYFADLIPLGLLTDFELHTYGIQTIYHKLITERDNQPREFASRMLRTIKKAETTLTNYGTLDEPWGKAHTLKLESPLDALFDAATSFLPKRWASLVGVKPSAEIERAGAWFTIDAAPFTEIPKDGSMPKSFNNNYGPLFRMITILHEKGPFETYSITPRGKGSPFDEYGARAEWELKKYANGEYGPLVPPISHIEIPQ